VAGHEVSQATPVPALFPAHEQMVDFRLLHDALPAPARRRAISASRSAGSPPHGSRRVWRQDSADLALRERVRFFF